MLSTNTGADELPFQGWRRFKEAFAPEIVQRAVDESPLRVKRCVDPFGGSGTTAVACQFLGIHPITAEVNPYLADLIEAKICTYDADSLAADLGNVIRGSVHEKVTPQSLRSLPPTFVEPGLNDRWLFDRAVVKAIFRIRLAISRLEDNRSRRLFRVLLGGVLMICSNAVTSGKGRRYRGGWKERPIDRSVVLERFTAAAQGAISEIYRFRHRAVRTYELLRGDSRRVLKNIAAAELSVFSPPYPNSFDYTDVYNVELWMLGYLRNRAENTRLRHDTLSSHVQVLREFAPAPQSMLLNQVLNDLARRRSDLWSPWIPQMIGAYFADMHKVLGDLSDVVLEGGCAWLAVGDSRYADVHIPTASILAELARDKWSLLSMEPFRSMRTSPQQGGDHHLNETLMILRNRA